MFDSDQERAAVPGRAGRDAGPAPVPRDVSLTELPRDSPGPLVENERWDVLLGALHAANSLIVVADVRADDRPLVFVNDYFCRFTGYSRAETIGRNCRFLQTCPDRTRDDGQPGLAAIRKAMAAGEPCVTLLRNYKKDGTPFWNELYLSPLRGDDGAPAYYVGVQNDVTARVGAERERAVLVEALRTLEESVVITGPELDRPGPTIRYVNDAFERMTGYAADEALGRTPRLLQGPDTDRAELDRLRRILAAGDRFCGETVNYTKAGDRYLVQWTVAPVRAPDPVTLAHRCEDGGGAASGAGPAAADGPPTHWVASQRDVTERRALAREVLEGRTREQARIARDLHDGPAQEAAAVCLLAAALAGRLGLDVERPVPRGAGGEPDPTLELAAKLLEQARLAARGVREVARGLAPVEPVRGGLCQALRRVADTVAEFTPGIGATFRGDPADEPDDPATYDELFRIAREAVGNAVRHSGAKAVSVTLARAGDDRRDVTLEVLDDGRGLPAALAEAASTGRRGGPGRTGGPTGGVGLRSIRYRTEVLGASVTFARRPPAGAPPGAPAPADGEPCGGTRVTVHLPAPGPPG